MTKTNKTKTSGKGSKATSASKADKPQPKAAKAGAAQPKEQAGSKRAAKAAVVATGGAATASATPAPARGRFTDEQVIRVLVADNPKKPGTKAHEKFGLLRTGQTVGAYRKAVSARWPEAREWRDELGWCLKQKWITVGKGKA